VSNAAAATTAMLLTVSFYVIATTLPATVVYVLEESFPQGPLHLSDDQIRADPGWQRFFRYLTVRRITEEVRSPGCTNRATENARLELWCNMVLIIPVPHFPVSHFQRPRTNYTSPPTHTTV